MLGHMHAAWAPGKCIQRIQGWSNSHVHWGASILQCLPQDHMEYFTSGEAMAKQMASLGAQKAELSWAELGWPGRGSFSYCPQLLIGLAAQDWLYQ